MPVKSPKRPASPSSKKRAEEPAASFLKNDILEEAAVPVVPKKSGARPKKASAFSKGGEKSKPEPARGALTKREERIDKELKEIYGNSDGTLPDMRHFEKGKKRRVLSAFVLLFASFLFFGVAAYGVLFGFTPGGKFSDADIVLAIEGSAEAASGDEVRYNVTYKNTERVALNNATLELRYPEGFVFEGSSKDATNENKSEWKLGALEPGAGETIEVWGKFYGSIHEKQSLRAFFTYTPANFSSEFQKVAVFETIASNARLLLSVEGPGELPLGSEGEWVVKLEPTEGPIGNLSLSLVAPAGFVLKASDPAWIDEESGNVWFWNIAELKEPLIFKITGTFTEGEKASLTFGLIQRKDIKDRVGYTLAEASKEVTLLATGLSTRVVVNGSFEKGTIRAGETLNVTLSIQNTGEASLTGTALRLMLDAPSVNDKSLLKWTELTDDHNGAVLGRQESKDIRRGMITWDAGMLSGLSSIAPGKEVTLDISIPLKTGEEIDLKELLSQEIQIFFELDYEKQGEKETQSSNRAVILVNSDTALEVQHEAEEKHHTMRWIVSNTFHPLKDITLEADLFGDISWKAEELVTPAGTAVFDAEKKRLTWKIGEMPLTLDVLALQFGFTLNSENPSQKNLTSKLRFTATDATTGEMMVIAGDEVLLGE